MAPATLRAAARHTPRAAGFTLIEILVVLVIIAVLTTLAVMSVSVLGRDRELDSEGDRYTDVAAAGTEQSQLEGREFGIWFAANRYQVLAWVPQHRRWEDLPDDRLYEQHDLPPGVTARLEIEGKQIVFLEKPNQPRVPQVMLYSSGDVSPYRLMLNREGSDQPWTVEAKPDGALVVTRPGAEVAR